MNAKSIKVAEPIIIGTEAEAKDYASKHSGNEVPKKKLLPINYSIRCEIGEDVKNPPFPDMHYEYLLNSWMPDDVEKFEKEHGVEFRKYKSEKFAKFEAEWNETHGSDVTPESQSTTAPITATKADNLPNSMVQQVEQSTGAPSTPKKQTKSSAKSKAKKVKEESEKPYVPDFNMNIIEYETPVSVPESNPEPDEADTTTATVEQPKSTRVSQKMVDADFDALAEKFLQVTSLGEKKPVFLPKNVRDTLEILARLGGDPRISPSHIAINIIQTFIDEHRDLINRKLGSVKLSI